jgi:hypothetical protein
LPVPFLWFLVNPAVSANPRNQPQKRFLNYQLALRTPGISPFKLICRKQMRQSPNFRMNARGRPHRLHRLMRRDENFGFRFAFSTSAFFAMCSP